jgi:Bacterial DNA-binding protein
MTTHLKSGARIRISGIGTLEVRKREARTSRNPATGETMQIAASKKSSLSPGQGAEGSRLSSENGAFFRAALSLHARARDQSKAGRMARLRGIVETAMAQETTDRDAEMETNA